MDSSLLKPLGRSVMLRLFEILISLIHVVQTLSSQPSQNRAVLNTSLGPVSVVHGNFYSQAASCQKSWTFLILFNLTAALGVRIMGFREGA